MVDLASTPPQAVVKFSPVMKLEAQMKMLVLKLSLLMVAYAHLSLPLSQRTTHLSSF
ncbi:hypothetical protein AHAS_Ahas04G0019900 [Arachis hypogaea]